MARRRRELLQSACAQGRDGYPDAEDAIAQSADDVIVHESVDGVDQVRLLAQRVRAAGSDADLQSQFGRADGRRAARYVDVAGHRSGQEHGGRTHERGVDDLEVVMTEGECRITGGRQRPEPQALDGIRLLLIRASRATGSPRGHETPLPVVDVVDLG